MSAHRQSAALIAKYTPHAAAKLVQLTGSEKVETARKACVDIISLPALLDKRTARPNESQSDRNRPLQQMTEQTASRLLAVLADEKSDGQIREF